MVARLLVDGEQQHVPDAAHVMLYQSRDSWWHRASRFADTLQCRFWRVVAG
jgi:hypothetical protein